MTKHYAEQQAKPDFAELEKRVLKFWEEDKTFEKSVHNRDGAAEFVFYDGPPFANGTPHYGHIMVSYVKDVVARFQTMSGKKVERRLVFPAANRSKSSGLKNSTISAVRTY